MKSYKKFYEENLYPLQDGILKLVKDLNTPFYLTGGTALSRHYFHHRFSDDLDLFVNREGTYPELINEVFKELENSAETLKFSVNYEQVQRTQDYTQIFLTHNFGFSLKLDFINDVARHFGGFEESKILGRVDSWRNILSNKITALLRLESKDFVDLWIIAKNKEFSWPEIFSEAKKKDAGIDPIIIIELLNSIPHDALDMIKWTRPFNLDEIQNEFTIIANDIFAGNRNSLFVKS